MAAEARQRKLEDKRLKKKLAKLSETPEQKLARREAKQAAKVLVLHIYGHRFFVSAFRYRVLCCTGALWVAASLVFAALVLLPLLRLSWLLHSSITVPSLPSCPSRRWLACLGTRMRTTRSETPTYPPSSCGTRSSRRNRWRQVRGGGTL